MNQKIDFEVTDKAGVFVAGRRSPGVGKTLSLTEEEAHHAIQLGELRLPGKKGGKPAGGKLNDPPGGAGGEGAPAV